MEKVVGVDVHKHQHVAALLDGVGRTLARLTFANTADGTQRLLAWLDTHDADGALIGIENAASYGQTLTVALAHAGLQCVDVPPWRTSQQRKTLGPGKSDAIDAEAIARVVLARGATLAPALQPELVRAMGLLDSTRDQEVRDRTKTIVRLRAVWASVDPVAEAAARNLAKPDRVRRLRRIVLPDSLVEQTVQRTIRMLAARIAEHNHRIAQLESDIATLLDEHGNPVAELVGAGPIVAAKLIAHAGDPSRFRSPAAFAAYSATAPITCGSGKTNGRHRLNQAGNRQLNAAIHRIALTQARCHPDARVYIARKISEGKTPREARRALKRHLANVVYRHLNAWADTNPLT